LFNLQKALNLLFLNKRLLLSLANNKGNLHNLGILKVVCCFDFC